jgi:hypothetical protein
MQPSRLPNIFYVALSRASCTLHVINDERSANFSFIKREYIEQHCTYHKNLNCVFDRQEDTDTEKFANRDVKPSKICEHIDTLVLSDCIARLSVNRYNAQRPLPILSKTRKHIHGSIENVSYINGAVVNILLQRLTENTENLKIMFWKTCEWLVKHKI